MVVRDKQKQKEYAAMHYLRNKELVIARTKANNKVSRIRNRTWLKEYLNAHPCVDCGNNNPIVLEFDHVRGIKKMDISNMSNGAYSISTLQKEVAKCDVRCANCHRIVTHNRRVALPLS